MFMFEGLGETLRTIAIILLLVLFLVRFVILSFLKTCFQRIPPQHRKMGPGWVWLSLIPGFDLFWSFFIWPRLAQSFRSYFDSTDHTVVGNCGEDMAWTFCILRVGFYALVAALVEPRLLPIVYSFEITFAVIALTGVFCFMLILVMLGTASSLKNQIPAPKGTR